MNNFYLLGSFLFVAFAGSWHCTLMCGPIVCGLSKQDNIIFYHLGRLATYLAGGALFGYLGQNLFALAPMPLKAIVAVVLSLFFVSPWFPQLKIDFGINKIIWRILKYRPHAFAIGMISALLPCGWLWTFYAGAAASGSTLSGVLVLFFLWTSSLPALSLLPQLLKTQTKHLNAKRALIVRALLTCSGVYTIWSHVLF